MQEPADAADADTKRRPSLKLVRARASEQGSGFVALVRREWRMASAIALFVFGIVFVMLGWVGAAYTNIVSEQIPYVISGGLLGLGLIVVAGIMASAAARDRESAELRREIVRALAVASAGGARPGGAADLGPARAGAGAPAGGGARVYAVPGGRSFHLAGCPIIEGKDGVRELAPASARTHGLEACKLCTD
jgi:hypothetical protein